MPLRSLALVLPAALLLAAATPLAAQMVTKDGPHEARLAVSPVAGLTWAPIQPPGFDPGMEIAVLHGDPGVADKPYVIRLRFRDGYRFPPHWHPVTENLTVLSGEFLLAMGERSDESRLQTYRPGDFLHIEGKHPHFGGARGATTIQLHGMGPFAIIVVGSAEDRRE